MNQGKYKNFDIIKRALCTYFYLDNGVGFESSILLAGYPRSGTTWVSDIINYKNEYRYIFEPFRLEEVSLFRQLKFSSVQYIRDNCGNKQYAESIHSVLSGKLRSRWSNHLNKKFISNQRLIKAVRANLLLGYLYQNFPGLPIVFLIRHPCAVAISRLKLGWKTGIDKYLSQSELMTDYLHEFRKEMEKVQDSGNKFEQAILSWCIENYVPLQQFQEDEICLVFYENLCQDPAYEIRRIFSFLDNHYDESVLASIYKPSKLSRKDSSIITGNSLLDGWRQHVSKSQLKRAIEILKLFGLDKIYSYESVPCTSSLGSLLV